MDISLTSFSFLLPISLRNNQNGYWLYTKIDILWCLVKEQHEIYANRYIIEGKGHRQIIVSALTVISFSGSSVASIISFPVTIFLSLSTSCFSLSSKSSDFASGAKIK